jgi:pimeloyl-ACP methyl ester carboxylesterase
MHDEGLIALPDLLEKLGVENPVLVGHSDGASIALIYAGSGKKTGGVVAMAPHVFIEPLCLRSIDKAAEAFEKTDFGVKLSRYHRDARKTFYGWADVWLDKGFKGWDIRGKYLTGIRCPVLGIQGFDDVYGTMAQLDELQKFSNAQLLKLEQCGHAPFKDQPEKVLSAVVNFVEKL